MNKLLYFFKTHGIDWEFIGNSKKVGLKKDNTLSNRIVEIDSYLIKCNNSTYNFDFKKSGRPQYILMSDKILINASSKLKFIKEFLKIEKVEKIKKDLVKEKIQGTVFRMLRHYLKMNKKQLGQTIQKSELTIMRYEDGTLALHSNVVLAVLTAHNLKLNVYLDIFESILRSTKTKYKINDFKINEELIKFYEKYGGVEMADFLKAEEVAVICKIKKPKAYKIIKEINDEMEKKGYIVIRGRVNRRFFNERMGIIDTDKGGKA